jgi:hypothetical protein
MRPAAGSAGSRIEDCAVRTLEVHSLAHLARREETHWHPDGREALHLVRGRLGARGAREDLEAAGTGEASVQAMLVDEPLDQVDALAREIVDGAGLKEIARADAVDPAQDEASVATARAVADAPRFEHGDAE